MNLMSLQKYMLWLLQKFTKLYLYWSFIFWKILEYKEWTQAIKFIVELTGRMVFFFLTVSAFYQSICVISVIIIVK